MGQFASGTAPKMLGQAQTLFTLYRDADLSCMKGEYAKRLAILMASQTFKPNPEPMTLEAFGQDVRRRVALAGGNAMPRNSGTRRTEGQKTLVAAIEASATRW